VQSRALELLKQGIRVNAILPGPTDTPLARANEETWLGFGTDYRSDAGIEASRPDEQAGPLVFLCSDAASHVSGEILIVDAGFTGSGVTGAYETAAMAVEFMENM
jgi:NAD(P)-dependent dehydrogenase (short-subunit alcohol dehydrogenase family)